MDSGTTVKESVSNQSGLVFAVACYGPARAPLREVLGAAVLSTFLSAPATSWSTARCSAVGLSRRTHVAPARHTQVNVAGAKPINM
ncbi:DUF2844 domain-containing protein [Paraburkholderia youngii]|uniref:DUF2844 domain-containing protein n=1 Tax=Paraburkholderia youngii TaxID=2782701 RepID=UPI003D21C1FC